jgi:hypothetical protein
VSASFFLLIVFCCHTSELFASSGADSMCSPSLRGPFSVEKGDLKKQQNHLPDGPQRTSQMIAFITQQLTSGGQGHQQLHLVVSNHDQELNQIHLHFKRLQEHMGFQIISFKPEQTLFDFVRFEQDIGLSDLTPKHPVLLFMHWDSIPQFFSLYKKKIHPGIQTVFARFTTALASYSEGSPKTSEATSLSYRGFIQSMKDPQTPFLRFYSLPEKNPKVLAPVTSFDDHFDAEIRRAPIMKFQGWVRSLSADDLTFSIDRMTIPEVRWFHRLLKEYPGNSRTGRNGWWNVLDKEVVTKVAATGKIHLPWIARVRFGLEVRTSQSTASKIDQLKVFEFEKWLRATSPENVRAEILSRTGAFKAWFADFREYHPGMPFNDRPGWWEYFTLDSLRIIYATQKIDLPDHVLNMLGVPKLPKQVDKGPRVALHKVREFEKWVLSAEMTELHKYIISQNYLFSGWFPRFMANHPGNNGKSGWWGHFTIPALQKIYMTGKVMLPDDVIKRLNVDPSQVIKIPSRMDLAKKLAFEKWVRETQQATVGQSLYSEIPGAGKWFVGLLKSYPDKPNSTNPPWWSFLSKDVLKKINATYRLQIPDEAFNQDTGLKDETTP